MKSTISKAIFDVNAGPCAAMEGGRACIIAGRRPGESLELSRRINRPQVFFRDRRGCGTHAPVICTRR